jgi:sugar O-acyltransferase (sialic acid O-acetyltransferase NeuD family)
VADAALATQDFSSVSFLDDQYSGQSTREGWPIVGSLEQLEDLSPEFQAFAPGMADPALRLALLARARHAGLRCVSIVHPGASLSRHSSIGDGTVIVAGARINVGVRTGEACIINTGATVDHDCVLAEAVHICPGAHLAGNVEIGARTWFGIGAVARQGIRIGANAMIGAGSVVVRDVPDNATVFGVPAREKRP